MTKRLLLVCLALSACSNNGSENQGDDAPPIDGNTTSEPVKPQVGAWDYDSVTPISNTCPGELRDAGTGAFAIDASSTTSFHVIPNDGTAAFTCTLNGSAYDCPDRAAAVRDLRPAVDAVITMRATAHGTFSSSTRATGTQDATATCAGTQCSATGVTFPCMAKVDYVVQAR